MGKTDRQSLSFESFSKYAMQTAVKSTSPTYKDDGLAYKDDGLTTTGG